MANGKLELIHAGRNRTKARVWSWTSKGVAGGPSVSTRHWVLKEITACPVWMRVLFARRLLAREASAYRELSGVRGVPALRLTHGADLLAIDFIDGTPLHQIDRSRLTEEIFDRLSGLLTAIHERGVVCGDLHHRNVIIGPSGEVHLVDFALATIKGPAWRIFHRWLTRRLEELDNAALVRIRMKYMERPATMDEAATLRRGARLWRFGRSLKRVLGLSGAGTGKTPARLGGGR